MINKKRIYRVGGRGAVVSKNELTRLMEEVSGGSLFEDDYADDLEDYESLFGAGNKNVKTTHFGDSKMKFELINNPNDGLQYMKLPDGSIVKLNQLEKYTNGVSLGPDNKRDVVSATEYMMQTAATSVPKNISLWQRFLNLFKGKKAELSDTEKRAVEAVVQNVISPLDPYVEAIKESRAKIDKLKVISNFFSNDTLTMIVEQCNTVHTIFDRNRELNHKKLEQFHYYYTDHLLELLKKLKKSKEENIIILSSKLGIIDDKILNIKTSTIDKKTFSNEKKVYASNVSWLLSNIYNGMSKGIDNMPTNVFDIVSRISNFENKTEYFDMFSHIDADTYTKLSTYDSNAVYSSWSYYIERKLMGKLNKAKFDIEFVCHMTCQSSLLALFKIGDTTEYFIYDVSCNSFVACNFSEVCNHIENTQVAKEARKRKELSDERSRIAEDLKDMRKITNQETINIISDYYKKISEVDFLNKLSDVNLEQQQLRAMINTTMMDI